MSHPISCDLSPVTLFVFAGRDIPEGHPHGRPRSYVGLGPPYPRGSLFRHPREGGGGSGGPSYTVE